MEKYGINNVRGGSFCEIKLSNENKKTIEKIITSTTEKCYKCGKKGHFASKCPNESDEENNLSYETYTEKYNKLSVKKYCYRCRRKGHSEKNCYASTYNNGDIIYSSARKEKLTIKSLKYAFVEENKDDGVYEWDGKKYLWENLALFEESPHENCGARDETFYDSKYDCYWRPTTVKSTKK